MCSKVADVDDFKASIEEDNEGLITVLEINATLFAEANAFPIALSTVDHFAGLPFCIGPCSLSLSYKPRTEAIICALTTPFESPKSLFPLTKIGRPSLVFTKTLA